MTKIFDFTKLWRFLMKNFVIAAVLFFVSYGPVRADDCCAPKNVSQGRIVHFYCVTPKDALRGTACYIGGVGHRVIHGVGSIIKAPFVTPYRVPVYKRSYRYVPPRYIPGRLYRIQEVPAPAPAPPAIRQKVVPMPSQDPISRLKAYNVASTSTLRF